VATVSTTGATGCFIRSFRAAFFTGARLGLGLATVRGAALAPLRALPHLAEFPLRSFARLGTFDPFLRLAVIDPPSLVGFDQTPIRYVPAIHLTSHQQADLHCTKSDACHRSPRSRNIGSTQ